MIFYVPVGTRQCRVPTDGFWGNHIYVRGLDNDLGLLYCVNHNLVMQSDRTHRKFAWDTQKLPAKLAYLP